MRRASLLFLLFLASAGPAASQGAPFVQSDLSNTTLLLGVALGVLGLAPGLLIAFTCFPYFVVVFSILRQAMGLQQAPPNMLIISLALFATFFVMEPVLRESWTLGQGVIESADFNLISLFQTVVAPFKVFMEGRVDEGVATVLQDARGIAATPEDDDLRSLSVLVPAFLLSEIGRAFEVGFLVFVPFLVIDLVVSAILMSMGMMMVPPAIVALPFKLAFFALVDGWALVSGGIITGYLT